MLTTFEAPENYRLPSGRKTLFVGGGISGCVDWQKEFLGKLSDQNLICFNPRRAVFPNVGEKDPEISREQIQWEHNHLMWADAIAFWFPSETLCPITLYELGTWTITQKPLFVGIHPEYQRKLDIEIQTREVRRTFEFSYSVDDMANQVKKWLKI